MTGPLTRFMLMNCSQIEPLVEWRPGPFLGTGSLSGSPLLLVMFCCKVEISSSVWMPLYLACIWARVIEAVS